MKAFRLLAIASAVVAWVLAVLGSWTRINGAGLACPDWPLCNGSLIPPLQGGVLLEWSHRVVALTESVLLALTLVAGLALRRRIAGLGPTLIALVAIFAVQVGLGGATVLHGNNPGSVGLHWSAAMLLLATLVTLASLSVLTPVADGTPVFRMQQGTAIVLAATVFALAASIAGAVVSSSGAGLACPAVPGCDGDFFGHTNAQRLGMTHRMLAVFAALFGIAAALAAPRTSQPAPGTSRIVPVAISIGLVFILLQITLGVLNVAWSLPIALREAHAANAGLSFATLVLATVLSAYARKRDGMSWSEAYEAPPKPGQREAARIE